MAQQARILHKHGHRVTLFSGYNSLYPYTPEELEIENIPAHVSELWGPDLYGFPFGALVSLWKHVKELDVVHLNGAWNLTTFLASLICSIKKIPYIISCRSHYGDYHFSRKPLLKKVLFYTFEYFNITHSHGLHVTADWETQTSWRAASIAKNIIKIPNPVNLSDFASPPHRRESRERLGLKQDGLYIVHLGRLGKQKNLTFLIRAFHQADLGQHARLVLIGPPEEYEKNAIRKLSAELKIENRLTFIDFAKGKERCDWLAAADLFALPSHDENFCIAAIESVASGTHCLLSPHIGATEYLPDDYASVKPVDVEQWADWLREYSTHPQEQRIPDAELFTPFSEVQILKDWERIYHSIKYGTV